MFEQAVKVIDMKIAANVALMQNEIDDEEFGKYVKVLKDIHIQEVNLKELEERKELVISELNWFVITQDNLLDEEAYEESLKEIESDISETEKNLATMKEQSSLLNDVGPCYSSLDATLISLGVYRQAYHGSCFVGNHCHKLLKEDSINMRFRAKSYPGEKGGIVYK